LSRLLRRNLTVAIRTKTIITIKPNFIQNIQLPLFHKPNPLTQEATSLFQELYPKETANTNANIDKAIMITQIIVIIAVKLLGISERFFKVAKSKNKLTSIKIIKNERST
jgi:hypothetical protein